MNPLLSALIRAWHNDTKKDASAFPFDRVHLRKYSQVLGVRPLSNFVIEGEYHMPDQVEVFSFPSSFGAYSNDGQTVYDSIGGEKADQAYESYKDSRGLTRSRNLFSIPFAYDGPVGEGQKSFLELGSGKNLLFWHPALHRWPWDSKKKMYSYPTKSDWTDRVDLTDPTRLSAFVSTLGYFMGQPYIVEPKVLLSQTAAQQ